MTNKNFTIKSATRADVPLILSFIKELAEYEKLAHEVVATEELLAESLFGEDSPAKVIFAYLDNKAVGFALYFYNFSTFLGKPGLYLEDLYVKPEVRGQGIGKKILAYLAFIAKQKNCGRFEWWVLDWNKPALDFYKSIGAKPMDEWTVQRVTGKALDELASYWSNS